MNASDLHAVLRSPSPPVLLHVLPAEVFNASRIPGSRNACVYEMSFLDQIRALVSGPGISLVVYGAGAGSLDAVTAAEKLRTVGFTAVEVFAGGLAAWQAAGLPLEGSGSLPQPPVPDGRYRLDPARSTIRWTGRNLFNFHHGTVPPASGEILLHQGQLVSASFTIDLTGIACEDLTDPAMNALLLAHLRTADFFDTDHHPTAQFNALTAETISTCTDGTPNYLLRGTFTLRGITHPLEFPILLAPATSGQSLTAQGQFELDRTAYGSHYGSGKFFRFLGQHLVNDHIHLHVKIHADRVE